MSDVLGSDLIAGGGMKPPARGSVAPLPVDPHVQELQVRDLQVRVVSAAVMVAVGVAMTWAGTFPFALLVLVVALMIGWEWGHLVRGEAAADGFVVHAAALTCAIALALFGFPVLALISLAAGAVVLAGGGYGANPMLSAAGIFYAGVPAIALMWLRADPSYGFAVVLFLFLAVWMNDTMAFAVGKSIGRVKLWPSISPKKTWEGFLGGILASAITGFVFAHALAGVSQWRLAVIGAMAGAVALGGDLAESALKRRFGVKDAGAIIPGHGGVMDRMDGIVAVAVAAALVALALGGRSPAAALLIGG